MTDMQRENRDRAVLSVRLYLAPWRAGSAAVDDDNTGAVLL